ncbi:MAG TPA: MMPL family transporter, partial [Blastocatellia bacterium]|nr:MMPL family transporter [Blastocatellia bacterium]
MSRFIVGAVRRPFTIISIVIALTALSALGLRRGVRLDVSPLEFVERGSKARTDFENARKNFGPDDYLVVAVVCDDVFAPADLARLRELHDRISKTRGVAEVLSLINAPCARSVDGVVSAEKLIPVELEETDGQGEGGTGRQGEGETERRRESSPDQSYQSHKSYIRDGIRRLATSDSLYVGNLVSSDSRTAALNILLKSDLPTATRHAITKWIYESARNAGFDQVYFAGDPFSQWRGTEAIKSDLNAFLPLTLLLIAMLLWLCFRSFVAVAMPLLTIGIGLLWLMGLMAWFDAPFTILALMLPTLMLAIGCSYMVHVINQIGISRRGVGSGERGIGNRESGNIRNSPLPTPHSPLPTAQSAIEEALRLISIPVIVSALTIIAGFLSLVFTAIPTVRATAIYAAIGAAFTMLLSLTFVPATLILLGERAIRFRIGLSGGMVKLLEGVGRWATSNQTPLYILTAIIVVVSAVGVGRIVIDIDYFHFSNPNSEASVGLDEISKRLSGAVNFDIIVEGKNARAIEKPGVLRRIAELQAFAETRKNAKGAGVDRA